MDPSTVNWLAVIVSTIAFYVIGGLWYSPVLFGKIWMKEVNMKPEDAKKANMAKIMPLTFLLSIVMVTNLAFFLNDPKIDASSGAIYGFLTGFGWVSMAIILTALYEMKSWRYMLIHAGYMIIGFTLSGLILGAWK
ncbi:MAG: DUF1761 domain-containing protein [Bacteroidales bacterium]|nr:DUF1761 domain-containing protein [Bacteroidales bacterium]